MKIAPNTSRGADEIDFLGSRANTTPYTEDTARHETTALRIRYANFGRHVARQGHDHGTTLNTLYSRHADVALGYSSFTAYLDATWQEGSEDALGLMLVARFGTADDVEKYLITRSHEAARICRALGVASLGKLAERDLPLPSDLGGGTIRLAEATVVQLRGVLRALKEPPPSVDRPEGADAKVRRTRANVEALIGIEPRYRELDPRVSWSGEDVAVTIRATGRALQALGAKFLDQLSRKR